MYSYMDHKFVKEHPELYVELKHICHGGNYGSDTINVFKRDAGDNIFICMCVRNYGEHSDECDISNDLLRLIEVITKVDKQIRITCSRSYQQGLITEELFIDPRTYEYELQNRMSGNMDDPY